MTTSFSGGMVVVCLGKIRALGDFLGAQLLISLFHCSGFGFLLLAASGGLSSLALGVSQLGIWGFALGRVGHRASSLGLVFPLPKIVELLFVEKSKELKLDRTISPRAIRSTQERAKHQNQAVNH